MDTFGMHEELACFHSPYFRAAFQGNFLEANTRELVLEKTDPEVFGLFVQWVYTLQIEETFCTDQSVALQERHRRDLPRRDQLIELWFLAEYLQVPKLQNHAIELIREKIFRANSTAIKGLEKVYEQTTCGSPIRRIFVDYLCWSNILPEYLSGKREHFPPGMIFEWLIAERRRGMEPTKPYPIENPANYHVEDSLT